MKPYPLTRTNRIQLARLFATVPRVDIAIECVLEDQMGKAFVDAVDDPHYAMIETDGYFCYLAGDFTQPAGRTFIQQIPAQRMIMAGSDGWHDIIQNLTDEDRYKPVTHYQFSSNTLSRNFLKTLAIRNSHTPYLQKIDATIAHMKLPYFEIGEFESPDDFLRRGIGYCLLQDKSLIGIIYSALVNSRAVEVSIVVQPEHQRRGIATALSCQLLMWCLDRHIEPHWDASNPESSNLAKKLGYKALGEYTAYVSQQTK